MKLNNYLKPSLSLLWVLMVSYCAAAPDDDFKVNLKIYYHDVPEVAYKGSPVQGLCSAPLVGDDYLFLTVVLNIGSVVGMYMIHRNQITVNQSMEGLVVNKVTISQLELTGAKEADTLHTGFVFKICLREMIQFQCVLFREMPHKNKRDNDYALIIPSTRPRKPFLVVFYHMKPKRLIEGETVRVSCTAVVGTEGKLIMELTASVDHQPENWVIPFEGKATVQGDSGHPINLTFHRELTEQGPRITVWLRIPVTISMKDRWLICISSDGLENRQESSINSRLNVISLPFKPKLIIDSSISPSSDVWTLKAYCSSTDSNITGLSLALRTAGQTAVFMEKQDATGAKKFKWQRFQNRQYKGARSFLNVFFWEETRNNVFRLGMAAVLNASSESVVVTCRLSNIQVCRHYKPLVGQNIRKEPDEYFTKTPVSITIVFALVLGLLVCLLLVITMKTCMWRWEPESKCQGPMEIHI